MDPKTRQLVNPIYLTFSDMYKELQRSSPKELCIICLEEFVERDQNIIRMSDCFGHYFHDTCISQCRQGQPYVKCPVCSTLYGIQSGDMPSGTMKIQKLRGSLPGISAKFFYKIEYLVQPVIINGEYYQGTSREAFMPGDNEGSQMLSLLVWAFQRGLTFRPAVSNTTGIKSSVWNIHHKTSISGGGFAFPDPTYLSRLKEELYARGVKF